MTIMYMLLSYQLGFVDICLFASVNSFSFESEYLNLLLLWLTCLRSNSWQSYVLDVHPFNPRIAMSAGYDGQTIIWDVSFRFSFLIHCSPLAYFLLSCIVFVFLDLGRNTHQDL